MTDNTPTLSLDFETRSTVNLAAAGVYVYAEDPDTDIWCAAYAIGDEEPKLWVPGYGPPADLVEHVEAGYPIRAWNAMFERIIWRDIWGPRYGFPIPELTQWRDTMSDALAMALPAALGQCAKMLKVAEKDDEGRRLMLQMAKPRSLRPLTWWDDEERRLRLYDYCRQDVVVEMAIGRRIRPLPEDELAVYHLDQRMSDRGITVDLELVKSMQRLMDIGTERANEELKELTGISSVTKVDQLTKWLQGQGADIENLKKDTLRDFLAEEGQDERTARVVELRLQTAKSSTAKLDAMERQLCRDGKIRGQLRYHGASTGRWSGKGVQIQNLPRGEIKGVDKFIPDVLRVNYDRIAAKEPVPVVIASLLRRCLTASPGHRLMSVDYKQIEARVLAWIAGQRDLIELFASGGKVYEDMAAFIYDVDVDDIADPSEERTVGKNTVLGCGFQMGFDRFAEQIWEQTGILIPRGKRFIRCRKCGQVATCSGALTIAEAHRRLRSQGLCCERGAEFDVTWLEEDMARKAVGGYRKKNHYIKTFWGDIQNAAFNAVQSPGELFTVGRNDAIRYQVNGQFLWCQLPSGRLLAYAKPDIRDVPVPWDETKKERRPAVTYLGKGQGRKYIRRAAYGGLLTENVVQAMARDIMKEGMLRADAAGYPATFTVHDEVVADVPLGQGTFDEFQSLMLELPWWADGLPIAGEGWEGERYRK